MEYRDRDVSSHYPAHAEGQAATVAFVHKPTGCRVEGLLSEREALEAELRDKVAGVLDVASKVKESAARA